jgi:hypothetical protein
VSQTGVVLIPAGPRDDALDTIESVQMYLPDMPILVINDGHAGLGDATALGPGVVVLPPLPFPHNVSGGLWRKEAYAFKYVLANIQCDYVLRLDADALLIGPGLDRLIESALSGPGTGLAGSFRATWDGARRDFSPAARILAAETRGPRSWRRPALRQVLRPLLRVATANGYEPGEHALGCVVGIRTELLRDWQARGWLDDTRILPTRLSDDHLMGLVARAAGYGIAEVGGAGSPVAVKWKGLPASPPDLIASGALVTHSVRAWGEWDEVGIRRYFREARARAYSGSGRQPDQP